MSDYGTVACLQAERGIYNSMKNFHRSHRYENYFFLLPTYNKLCRLSLVVIYFLLISFIKLKKYQVTVAACREE
jgi:hypothetical protein